MISLPARPHQLQKQSHPQPGQFVGSWRDDCGNAVPHRLPRLEDSTYGSDRANRHTQESSATV